MISSLTFSRNSSQHRPHSGSRPNASGDYGVWNTELSEWLCSCNASIERRPTACYCIDSMWTASDTDWTSWFGLLISSYDCSVEAVMQFSCVIDAVKILFLNMALYNVQVLSETHSHHSTHRTAFTDSLLLSDFLLVFSHYPFISGVVMAA